MNEFEITLCVSFFIVLMANTWYMHLVGYVKGARGGHFVGVHDTVEYMMDKANLNATVSGENRPATVEEMTKYIILKLHEKHAE